MMKRIVLLLFGTMVFNSCSEDGMSAGNVPGDNEKPRFLAVGITNPSITSARETLLSDDYETGSGNEDKINSLRFYFFDHNGDPARIGITGRKNYADCTKITSEPESTQPNAEKRMQALVAINAQDEQIAGIGSLVAIANHETAALGTDALSLGELCARIGEYDAAGKGNAENAKTRLFPMTSSSYAGTDRQICTTTITPEHFCETEADAMKNPVTIYIERVVAKTRLKTAWNAENTTVTEGGAYKGRTYTAVKLKDAKGSAIKVGGKQVHAIFIGWNITGKADRSYLFKKVNTATAWQLGWVWNHPAQFRSYWATNPADVALKHIAYNEIDTEFGENNAAYCLENAADDFDNGTKKSYDPDQEISNRTQAIIAAVLITIDATNNAIPVDLARWLGTDYTEEGAKATMLHLEASQIFTKEEGAAAKFVPIKPEHVEWVTGTEAGTADDKSENSARYLSYLQLTDEARSLQFYSDTTDDAAMTPEAVDEILKNLPGAKIWKNGMTYYYIELKHLGSDERKGLFGVVRNHLYDVNINSVVGLGTPVYDPDEKIVPQKPDNDETYIAAKVDVLSWRVANNDFDFEW